MTIYIALLRGINVGGKNMIKMAELKRTLMNSGLHEVQTYIQSGNVLFQSDEGEESLRFCIEQAILTDFGFPVTVVLRTAEEMKQIADTCPFSPAEISAAEATATGECLHIAFLSKEPSQESVQKLGGYKNQNEDFRIIGREIYMLFSDSIRNSKLANHLPKLDVPATARNWKTLMKLVSLAEAMT
ncbi:DUF1697 domain-containing protein [Paenibacillus puldeungensis]|uniref:DUF1697 domain-containing protein n=1 Tax=Paenibacillus puldeungensis TaxID=696536 RepID=A0ABW3S2H8_9BACL